jgi:hypothetical protein
MKIEIDIPENLIKETAMRAWKVSFRQPEYHYKDGGDGYEAIRAEVQKHLMKPATIEEIRACVKSFASQLAPLVVRDAVTDELKRLVKGIVKQEKATNTLL